MKDQTIQSFCNNRQQLCKNLEGVTEVIQNQQQCVPAQTAQRGRQQGTAEQKLQCERRSGHTAGWHRSQRAAPDLYKLSGPIRDTTANNSDTKSCKSEEDEEGVKKTSHKRILHSTHAQSHKYFPKRVELHLFSQKRFSHCGWFVIKYETPL